jgi:hypothetical protein
VTCTDPVSRGVFLTGTLLQRVAPCPAVYDCSRTHDGREIDLDRAVAEALQRFEPDPMIVARRWKARGRVGLSRERCRSRARGIAAPAGRMMGRQVELPGRSGHGRWRLVGSGLLSGGWRRAPHRHC